jgi:Ca2+/Na+ antiporter
MIKKLINVFFEINYFSQRVAGWKNYREGFENLLFTMTFFFSSGLFVSLILPLVAKIGKSWGLILFILFSVFYYISFKKKFHSLLNAKVNFKLLDNQYEKASYLKKILSVLFSILFLVISVLSMVLIIYLFGIFWKMG